MPSPKAYKSFWTQDFVYKLIFGQIAAISSSTRRFKPNLDTSFFLKKYESNFLLEKKEKTNFFYFRLHILEPSMEIWLF